jgi:urease accessory protein UreF
LQEQQAFMREKKPLAKAFPVGAQIFADVAWKRCNGRAIQMNEAVNSHRIVAPIDITLLGEVHPLLQQLGSCDGLTDFGGYDELMAGASVRDCESLSSFLTTYQCEVLVRFELPTVVQAHNLAARNEARELIALDAEVARQAVPPAFASASRRVGQGHLQRLRPLRDQRVVQRYLNAVDNGEARGWHMIVYGITLAIYSLPVRQGLILYARQILEGFVRAAGQPLQLSALNCQQLIESFRGGIPKLVEHVLQQNSARNG